MTPPFLSSGLLPGRSADAAGVTAPSPLGMESPEATRTAAAPATAARRYGLVKRGIDVAASLILLALLLPVLVILALVVRGTSTGPALFRQERVGRYGRPFVMLKFRSMRQDNDDAVHRDYVTRLLTEDVPPDGGEAGVYKLARDPRVTTVGSFLRRTSLDELPQLWNVLKGEMSLVGPRPAIPYELENYKDWQHQRHQVKPGITGLWQVWGRGVIGFDEMIALDVRYATMWSIWLDIQLILLTVPVMLLQRGAK